MIQHARLVQNYSQELHPVPVKVSSTISHSAPILNCPDITVMVHWLLKTKFVDDVEPDVLGCQADIFGTNCDQCVCMVQCCFTSTETIRLIRTGAQDGLLDFHTASELCEMPTCSQ